MPHVYAVQFDIIWEDKRANHALVEEALESAKPQAGSLVVLPELFDVGFTLNVDQCSEQATQGASEAWCADLAQRLNVYVQGASIQRADSSSKATNNAVVFNPTGELICRYEKVFPFSGGNEGQSYRGGSVIETFDWHGLSVCPMICYDLRFPELFRLATLDYGAEVFTIGANWPTPRHEHWLTLLSARAIENLAFVVGVNRCGRDPFLEYSGGSRLVDPHGRILAEGANRPVVLSAEIDAEAVRSWREQFAALRDARRSLLGSL